MSLVGYATYFHGGCSSCSNCAFTERERDRAQAERDNDRAEVIRLKRKIQQLERKLSQRSAGRRR